MIYLTLAAVYSVLLFWVNFNNKKIIAHSVIFYLPVLYVVVVMSSIRWNTGTDWYMYHLFYSSSNSLDDFFSVEYFEKGYSFLNFISKQFDSYSLVLFFQILIIIFFWVMSIKISGVNVSIALFVLFSSKIYLLFPVRQDVAISIVWFFLVCYIKWGRLYLPLLGMSGCLFHSSAYISPLFYLSKINFKTSVIFCICFFCFLLGTQKGFVISGLSFLSGLEETRFARLIDYISGDVLVVVSGVDYVLRNSVRILESLVFLSIFLFYRSKVNSISYNSLVTIYFIGVCILLFSIFNFRIFLRFLPYFTLAEVFLWPIIFSYIKKNNAKKIYFLIFFAFVVIYNFKLFMVLKGFWAEYNPYQQILF